MMPPGATAVRAMAFTPPDAWILNYLATKTLRFDEEGDKRLAENRAPGGTATGRSVYDNRIDV